MPEKADGSIEISQRNCHPGPKLWVIYARSEMASCIRAQSNDVSMKPPHAPWPCPASDNIYSKSIALTIKSEAAPSDRFNGALTGRELIITQTLTCLLICFLFPSSSLTPFRSPRRNLGISNQVTASPPPVPSRVILLKLSEINEPYIPGPCQPLTLQLLSTRCRICHWSQQTEKKH